MHPSILPGQRRSLPVVLGVAGLAASVHAAAATYVVAHRFDPTTEGSRSQSTPVTDGRRLYGMTYQQGPGGVGTIYAVDRTGLTTVLHAFDLATEGGYPAGDLLLGKDGALYGTTQDGNAGDGCGTLFRMTTAGAFSVLHAFTIAEGCGQTGRLAQRADGTIFGVAYQGGAHQLGTVWSYSPAGALTVLHDFASGLADGARPQGGVAWDATTGTLYGTTVSGGSADLQGTVFALVPGTSFRLLHAFGYTDPAGVRPYGAPLVGADGALYGTTNGGGTQGGGSVYRLTTDGTLTVLHAFVDYASSTDGAEPYGPVTQGADGTLYGTTYRGGSANQGAVWRMSTGGVLRVLHSFTGGRDGAGPQAGVLLAPDGNLYGVTGSGGNAQGTGILFQSSTR